MIPTPHDVFGSQGELGEMKLKVKFKSGSISGREAEVFIEHGNEKFIIPVSEVSIVSDVGNYLKTKLEIVMPFSDEDGAFVAELFKPSGKQNAI